MKVHRPRWVRPCLLGTLFILGATFTWAVAQAQVPFDPGIRQPGIGPGPGPFGPRPGGIGGIAGINGGIGGINPGIAGINGIGGIEKVYTCSKCGRVVARGGLGTLPPANCPFCGVRFINGFGPPAGGPGIGGLGGPGVPGNPGMPVTPPVFPPGNPGFPPVGVNPPNNNPPAPQQPPVQLPKTPLANNAPAANNDSSSQSSGVGMIFLVGSIGVGVLALGLVSAGIVLIVMNGKKNKPRDTQSVWKASSKRRR